MQGDMTPKTPAVHRHVVEPEPQAEKPRMIPGSDRVVIDMRQFLGADANYDWQPSQSAEPPVMPMMPMGGYNPFDDDDDDDVAAIDCAHFAAQDHFQAGEEEGPVPACYAEEPPHDPPWHDDFAEPQSIPTQVQSGGRGLMRVGTRALEESVEPDAPFAASASTQQVAEHQPSMSAAKSTGRSIETERAMRQADSQNSELQRYSAGGYRLGDKVRVYTKSQDVWAKGRVAAFLIEINFHGLSKGFPFHTIKEDGSVPGLLRRMPPEAQKGGGAAPATGRLKTGAFQKHIPGNYQVGDAVQVYSNTKNQWFDGYVAFFSMQVRCDNFTKNFPFDMIESNGSVPNVLQRRDDNEPASRRIEAS